MPQGTESEPDIAQRVTAEVNMAAFRKKEHINKPQTVRMSQKGLRVHPPQPQEHSLAQASCQMVTAVSRLRETGRLASGLLLHGRQSPVSFMQSRGWRGYEHPEGRMCFRPRSLWRACVGVSSLCLGVSRAAQEWLLQC